MKTPLLLFALVLALCTPSARASLRLEGRLDGIGGGRVDLRIEVAETSSGREARTVQTLLIPQVRVRDGRFEIDLSTDLDAYDMARLSFAVTARPTESSAPFRPVADSRVSGSAP